MNIQAPFLASDLEELHTRLLSRAHRVVPMYDIHKGDTGADVLGLRHDVDDNAGSMHTALRLAEWEFSHGYSSTYYLLHDSHYWGEEALMVAEKMEELGHEVGIHVNAIAEAIKQQRDPRAILREAVDYLRTAVRVVGAVAHGDDLCKKTNGNFVNDEMFLESPRPDYGKPDRVVTYSTRSVKLNPVSMWDFGIEYLANWLPRGDYISDSGGRWSQPFERVVSGFGERGQLHMLVHPDWWAEAFVEVVV